MAFREVRVLEVREVLRLWLRGEGIRPISRLVGMDRKTVRRYIDAAEVLGVDRSGGEGQLTDELLGQVIERVRPDRIDGRGETRRLLDVHRDQLVKWLDNEGLTVVKAHELLGRQGVVVPERTLHRYALDELGVGRSVRSATVRVADGEPGDELQVDAGGADRPGIGQIFQPYPRATAGSPTSTRWDPIARELRVRYRDNGATGPTDIFLHESRSFPTGWKVETSAPAGTWSTSFDAASGVLSVTVADTGTDQAICVKPADAPTGCTAVDPVVPTPIAAPVPAAVTPAALTPAFTG